MNPENTSSIDTHQTPDITIDTQLEQTLRHIVEDAKQAPENYVRNIEVPEGGE